MTYSKFSLLRYLVLTNCFFYAYSSNNAHKPNSTKHVPIDIYLLLDESKIPSKKEEVNDFINKVRDYDDAHDKDAFFGETLIKCTTKDQQIKLLTKCVENSENNYEFYFLGDDLIECMRVGIRNLINNCSPYKDTCPNSKIALYKSLLNLLREKFDENYKIFLICSIKNKDKSLLSSEISSYTCKGKYIDLKNGSDDKCNDEYKCITSIKIFFKYNYGFGVFCEYFIQSYLANLKNEKIEVLRKKKEKIRQIYKEMNINSMSDNLKNIEGRLECFMESIYECIKKKSKEVLGVKNEDIVFMKLLNLIEDQNKKFNECFLSIKNEIKTVFDQILVLILERENKQEQSNGNITRESKQEQSNGNITNEKGSIEEIEEDEKEDIGEKKDKNKENSKNSLSSLIILDYPNIDEQNNNIKNLDSNICNELNNLNIGHGCGKVFIGKDDNNNFKDGIISNNNIRKENVYEAPPLTQNYNDNNKKSTTVNNGLFIRFQNNKDNIQRNGKITTVKTENGETITEELDSTPNIKFIQIPKTKGFGVKKVACCC